MERLDAKPTILGSGRQIGEGIPDPDDYGQVTLGSDREATYRKSSPVDLGGEDLTVEPVPAPREPDIAIPEPAADDSEALPAFTMAKQPDAPLSDAEHEKEVGWWQNTGRGFLNRAGDDLLTNLGKIGNKVVDKVTTAIPGSEYALPVAGARAAAGYLEEAGAAVGGRDYRVRGDWETVERSWATATEGETSVDSITEAAKQTGEFMLETGVVSLPDMFAMVAGMPAYLASRVEELATERAQNDGREVASAEDYAVGGTTATIVTAIDKMSLGFATKPLKRLLEKGIAPALKRIAGATVVEAGQEAVQEGLEYLGTGVGTEAGVTAEELKRRSLAGSVGGAGFGAGVSTVSNIAGALKTPDPQIPDTPDGAETGGVVAGSETDDDYQPTGEEVEVTEADIITPPEPVVDVTEESETDTQEAGSETSETQEPIPTIEENLRKAWRDAPQKVPKAAVEKAVTVGVHPSDVEFTGKDGAYKAGDVDKALNINKVGDTDTTIKAALKAAGQEEENAGTTGTKDVPSEGTAPGSGSSDSSVAPEDSSGTDEGTGISEESPTASEESSAGELPTLTKKFSRKPYTAEAIELGLTDADFEGIEPNKQGVYTKASLTKAVANKAKADRGPLNSDVEEVLGFIEENLPKSDQYKTEQTGRSRAGSLGDKATVVGSLVGLVDALHKNSKAPAEVIERAVELAGKFRKLGTLNAEQMAGKGFTGVVNAATLDPAIDELSELVTALDQGRAAEVTTKVDADLVEKAEAAEAKVVADALPLTAQQIAEQKSDIAKKRKKIREVEQGIRRSNKPNKVELLRETQKKLKEVDAAESLLDQKANTTEKATPTTAKRAPQKRGQAAPTRGTADQRQVKAETIKGVVEAKKTFTLLGIPEQVTAAAKKVADIPINMNHYSLLVGLIRSLKRAENTAVKTKDAATEQQSKKEQRALTQIVRDIISSPDETRDLAHERAAGELAKFNVHEDVILDVIDFAEASRTVVQKAVARAEETTENIREITVEEHMAKQAAELEGEKSPQQQMEDAMESGDWERVAELQATEVEGSDTGVADLRQELESDTIPLADEFDSNDATNNTFDDYRNSERDSTPLRQILKQIAPKGTPFLRKIFQRHRATSDQLGQDMLHEIHGGGDTQLSAHDVLDRITSELQANHPYHLLARLLKTFTTDAIVEWTDTLEAGVGGRHLVRYFGTQNSAEAIHWQILLSKDMQPREVIQTFLHEMVHNHTTNMLRTDVEAAASLEALREQVLETLDKLGSAKENTFDLRGHLYGLKNLDEFVAEAFTNPDFQLMLMSLEITPDRNVKTPTKKTNAWTSFVGTVRAMFGAKKYTAFDEVMRIAPEVFHGDSAYDLTLDLDGMYNNKPGLDMNIDSKNGILQRTVGDKVVRSWVLQRNNIVKNAKKELGEVGEDIAISSYSLMAGDDPQTLGGLKDGSDKAVEGVVQRLLKTGKYKASNLRSALGSMSLAVQTFDQIVRNHHEKFKTATGNALTEYEKVMRNKNRIAHRWQNRGAAIDEQWSAVEKSKNGLRFAQFVQDVTMSEVHPDYSWDKQKHLFSAQEQAVVEAQHTKLQKQWHKLSKLERATFIATRTYFTAQRKQLASAALNHLTRIYIKDPEAAKLAATALRKHKTVEAARASSTEVDRIFEAAGENLESALGRVLSESKLRGAYFPLRRFGDYVVEYSKERDLGTYKSKKVAKAKLTEWKREHPSNKEANIVALDSGEFKVVAKERGVEFFESSAEGKEALATLGKQGYKVGTEPTLKEDWAGRFDVGATQILKQAEKKFATDPTLTAAVNQRNEGIKNALQAAFVELLAENSIRKSTLQRKNVKGASLDGRRVFAERVFAGSYALADAETMFDQMDGLDNIWTVARSGDAGSLKAGQVARELTLRERHNVNDRKSSKFNDWVGSLGFLGFLAGPSYPIINATQPYMVGLPWLGARYGLKANTAMIQNASKFGPAVMKELIDSGMGLKRDPHQAIQNAIVKMEKTGTRGGVEMLQAMRDAGIMDSTFIDAVSEAAKGTGWNVSKTGLFKFAASAPKIVEVMNRTVMATTAYQLEMDKSGNKTKAIGVAKEAILQTQFDYSDFNKPRWFKNPVLRPFLLFKMYPQGIYGLMASAIKQATNGTKEEKRIGRNTMIGITASHTIMGGALGGIFMEPVRMLLSTLEMLYPFDDDDEENMPFWDKQRFDNNARGVAVDLIGDEYWAELLMRGIPRALGLDLSGRLGLHNLMFMGMADDGTAKNVVHKTIDQLGGAPLAVMASWERAAQYALNGDYQRAAESAAPKSLRDIMNTYRAGTRGLETFNGTQYMQPEEFSGFDHFVKMMGFSPAKTAEMMEERWAQMSYDKRTMARKAQVVNTYMHQRNMKPVREWNEKHPDFAVTPADFIRKMQGKMKDELLDYKGYPVDFGKPSVRKQARF